MGGGYIDPIKKIYFSLHRYVKWVTTFWTYSKFSVSFSSSNSTTAVDINKSIQLRKSPVSLHTWALCSELPSMQNYKNPQQNASRLKSAKCWWKIREIFLAGSSGPGVEEEGSGGVLTEANTTPLQILDGLDGEFEKRPCW